MKTSINRRLSELERFQATRKPPGQPTPEIDWQAFIAHMREWAQDENAPMNLRLCGQAFIDLFEKEGV